MDEVDATYNEQEAAIQTAMTRAANAKLTRPKAVGYCLYCYESVEGEEQLFCNGNHASMYQARKDRR